MHPSRAQSQLVRYFCVSQGLAIVPQFLVGSGQHTIEVDTLIGIIEPLHDRRPLLSHITQPHEIGRLPVHARQTVEGRGHVQEGADRFRQPVSLARVLFPGGVIGLGFGGEPSPGAPPAKLFQKWNASSYAWPVSSRLPAAKARPPRPSIISSRSPAR